MLKQMSSQISISQGEKDDSGGNKKDESEYTSKHNPLFQLHTSLFAESLLPIQDDSEGKKISIKESFSGK